MSLTSEEVQRLFPIHWLVWNNQHQDLKNDLDSQKYTEEDLERKDPRGRTPLLLAVTLGYIESVRVLLEAGADVNCEKDGWTAVQEATATGNKELLSLVLSRRDHRRGVVRSEGVPELLRKLSMAPDFYVEMKWEFTSWVPLVSRMCPFDTYKVYKRGSNVRVDTTLVGFENNRWQRGDRTYIFRGQGKSASLIELDHELCTRWMEKFSSSESCTIPKRNKAAERQRLISPIAINYLDTDKISFERNKSGIWGWRQDKTENINGYECKVYGANNVELVSKTRSEHVAASARRRGGAAPRAPLAGLLALADPQHDARTDAQPDAQSGTGGADTTPTESSTPTPASSRSQENLKPVSWQEYFSDTPLEREIGREREIETKVQKFKATLWLCDNYPLELQEQIMPILDLMAAMSSPHFAKLKDFVQMQLPSGFPVKIEIPLYHVLNARITFGNIFGTETPVPNISCIEEEDRISCVVDDQCFEVGSAYRSTRSADSRDPRDHEESLLQYAIHQSLMEAGSHEDQVDVWEALRGARPASPPPDSNQLLDHEERQLQRAIEASLATMPTNSQSPEEDGGIYGYEDQLVNAALAMSAEEMELMERELADDQRALAEALRLSMLDK